MNAVSGVLTALLLLALIAVYWKRHVLGAAAKPLQLGLAIVALALIAVRLAGGSGRGAAEPEYSLWPQAVGFRLGQVMAEDLPDGAKVLVLHSGADAYSRNAKVLLESHIAGIRQGAGGKTFQIVPWVPDLPPEERMMLEQEILPADLVARALKEHPDAQAYYSLMGPPPTDLLRRVGGSCPPIYAAHVVVAEQAFPLLQQDVLKAFVHERTDVTARIELPARTPPAEAFERRYRLERRAGSN